MPKTVTRDLTHQRFGRLTALYPTAKRQNRCVVWHCRCDCGVEKDISLNCLTQGLTRSCGCLTHGSHSVIDETGHIYGDLTVLRRVPNNMYGRARWRCRCRCGHEISVDGNVLRKGRVRSCGRRACQLRQQG